MKAATKSPKRGAPATKSANESAAKRSAAKRPARRAGPSAEPATGHVLLELKALAKELNKAAKGLGKNGAGNPKAVSAILGNVERMTADAATKSLIEAESAKIIVAGTLDTLNKDWNRRDIEAALRGVTGHLTNIMVAQEFQDLAGQALRKATKALVGAIIVVESGGPTDEQRLSQKDVDTLLRELMP